MKLASKMVTEQDTRFYKKLAIPTPYGNFPMIPKEVVYDEDSDFYLYYILGPGNKKIGRPMCFGYVWQEKNGYQVKSYRLNEDTVKNLMQFSKEKNVSQVSVLRNAYKRYIELNSANFKLNYETIVNNKRISPNKIFFVSLIIILIFNKKYQ